MPLDSSPKKFALDVASGLTNVNRTMLKRYTAVEIQKMTVGLQTVLKELRTQKVEAGDFQALKDKGMKMQKVNGAMRAIQIYIKDNKLKGI
jgi:hypothetical protein